MTYLIIVHVSRSIELKYSTFSIKLIITVIMSKLVTPFRGGGAIFWLPAARQDKASKKGRCFSYGPEFLITKKGRERGRKRRRKKVTGAQIRSTSFFLVWI